MPLVAIDALPGLTALILRKFNSDDECFGHSTVWNGWFRSRLAFR